MILIILKIVIKNKKKQKKLIIMAMNWMLENFWIKKIKMILINNLINHYFSIYKNEKLNTLYILFIFYLSLKWSLFLLTRKKKINNKFITNTIKIRWR